MPFRALTGTQASPARWYGNATGSGSKSDDGQRSRYERYAHSDNGTTTKLFFLLYDYGIAVLRPHIDALSLILVSARTCPNARPTMQQFRYLSASSVYRRTRTAVDLNVETVFAHRSLAKRSLQGRPGHRCLNLCTPILGTCVGDRRFTTRVVPEHGPRMQEHQRPVRCAH
jgi:hypothetical protein